MTLEASKHFLSIFILPCSLGVPGPFLITIVNRSLHHSAAVYVRGDHLIKRVWVPLKCACQGWVEVPFISDHSKTF